ncbi:transcriptional regulator [Nocardioides szechwanensis]|uniref:Pilus assembly protein CpaE n=1 Tax=Nocardioides szechwanensis TaxID=1005944 RepID=A0A1G9VAA4_9ACTN|nr:AAA family ATPase [Nocardioides szechwanensis]GEP32988.1 transcriptional regulator [Nocardioides szechwanensis]SDM68997.1 pilus assembly protein CpaE [Nocardioides szechwanensis]
MPVLVEPHGPSVADLLKALPTGSQCLATPERMTAWLDQHPEEYVVVLGPALPMDEAVRVCEELRTTRPTISVVLVRETLDTAVLTQAMKAGARDVVPASDLDAISAAVARAHQLFTALRGPAGAAHHGKVVTVFSPKGGVGKTTMSVNLALALTEGGARRVCLVDLDLAFGDVAITMQLFPTHSIEQAVGSEDAIDFAMLDGLLTRHHGSLMVLAAPAHPDVRERVTAALVSRILRTLKEHFDFVVVDTAPSFDDVTLTALDETDECVIVATLDVPTLKNVKVALETLQMLDIARGHRHLLLNRADDEVGISPDKVEAILGMSIAARVASSLDIGASTNAGNPIVSERPQHPFSTAITALASTLAGEPVASPYGSPAQAEPGSTAKRGLFRKKR